MSDGDVNGFVTLSRVLPHCRLAWRVLVRFLIFLKIMLDIFFRFLYTQLIGCHNKLSSIHSKLALHNWLVELFFLPYEVSCYNQLIRIF